MSSITKISGTCDIDTDEAALDYISTVRLQMYTVATEAIDNQPTHCAVTCSDEKSIYERSPCISSVKLNHEHGIDAKPRAIGVGAGPRLGVPVNDYQVGDGGQGG
jgi:hypothetical protein